MANNKQNRETINVLFIAAEADPFVKIGGLGDVAGSLPPVIRELSQSEISPVNIDIRLVIPFYPRLKSTIQNAESIGGYEFSSGNQHLIAKVYRIELNGIPIYLIDGDPIEKGGEVYSHQTHLDAEKFIFFTLACVKLPEFLKWNCQILHANDWHTGLAPYILRALPDFKNTKIKTILSVHNLPYLGEGCQPCMSEYGIPAYPFGLLPTWAQHLPLPLGLTTADRIIPVSPGYAQEIQTPEFGCGLERLLQSRAKYITGIVNGIDQSVWNPETDTWITQNYRIDTLHEKINNKKILVEKSGLVFNPLIPLLVVVSRMDYQKGIDLVVSCLQEMLDYPWQVIILGSGDSAIEQKCQFFAQDHPNRMRLFTGFNAELAHQLYAGGDIFLMPSRYEPCGISQMISMRYGTIPVARATGGLKDTIQSSRPGKPGTGYLFDDATPSSFAQALRFALQDFTDPDLWREIQHNAMKMDFSWDASALKYIQQYANLVKSK